MVGSGAGFVGVQPAHVDDAEVDRAGPAGEPVHDGIGGDPLGQTFYPVSWSGLAGDHGGQALVPVDQDREEVVRGRLIDADAKEIIDDQQVHEAVKELRTQVEESNQAARDNAAAATEAKEQLILAGRKHAEEMAALKSQVAEARATITTLEQTQNALIARIEPVTKETKK